MDRAVEGLVRQDVEDALEETGHRVIVHLLGSKSRFFNFGMKLGWTLSLLQGLIYKHVGLMFILLGSLSVSYDFVGKEHSKLKNILEKILHFSNQKPNRNSCL